MVWETNEISIFLQILDIPAQLLDSSVNIKEEFGSIPFQQGDG